MLYQSASGDAGVGTSIYTMKDSTMTCLNGAMFYCTNTDSIINLENNEFILSEDNTLLIVSKGRWGKDGSNGGSCILNATNQSLSGDIIVDEISSLELNLNSSNYEGTISSNGYTVVNLDNNSTWSLTGDSYISEFNGDIYSIITNGYTLYVNGIAL